MVNVKEDLTGLIFGRLTVLEQDEDYIRPDGRREAKWLCQCVCGNLKTIKGDLLTSRKTQSCGCLSIENISEIGKSNHKTNKYDLSGEYGVGITFNTSREFYFDLEDYEKIKDYCWSECVDTNGYHYVHTWDANLKKIIKMSHLIIGKNYDHINRNSMDNRKSNLRLATQSENMKNRKKFKNNMSGITGVYFHKNTSKWEARISNDFKVVYLGRFDNKDEAIKARLNAELEYYGEFAPQKHLFEQYNIVK